MYLHSYILPHLTLPYPILPYLPPPNVLNHPHAPLPSQVSDVDPLDQIAVEKAVESDAMADVIADNLQDVGFDNADVEAADAQITTVEVIEMPEPAPPAPEQVIVAQQEFQGVNPEEAQSEEFQDAVEQAVADQLNVDVEDVTISSVSTNEKV